MRAVVIINYNDERAVTITLSEVETPDESGGTLGEFLHAVVVAAIAKERHTTINVEIMADHEDGK